MSEASLKPVIDDLEDLFSKFNRHFFSGTLEKPVITVSPDHTRGAYGWCTGWKAWLIERVQEVTGLYFDRSYMYKIQTGQLSTPKIVQAIREILELPNQQEEKEEAL